MFVFDVTTKSLNVQSFTYVSAFVAVRWSSRLKALLHTSNMYHQCGFVCVCLVLRLLKALLHTSHHITSVSAIVSLDCPADRKLCYIRHSCTVSDQCVCDSVSLDGPAD